MYLREMGGVELLSREGEIAIAKRIESGKYVMVSALAESPLMAKKIFEWKDKLNASEMLVRDCLLYTSPSPRDRQKSRMPSSA